MAGLVHFDVVLRRALLVLTTLAAAALVCATRAWQLPLHHGCIAPNGDRCDRPLPISSLQIDRTGTRLSGMFLCGGWLVASEGRSQVTVTYLAPQVFPGARLCAHPTLHVRLQSPLGDRTVLDGVTHRAVTIA